MYFSEKNLKPFFPRKKIGSAFEAHQSATSSLRRLSINLDQKKIHNFFGWVRPNIHRIADDNWSGLFVRIQKSPLRQRSR